MGEFLEEVLPLTMGPILAESSDDVSFLGASATAVPASTSGMGSAGGASSTSLMGTGLDGAGVSSLELVALSGLAALSPAG